MNLIIDQGNTQFKIGIFDKEELKFNARFNYNESDAFKSFVSQYTIKNILVSSVINTKPDLSFISEVNNVFYLTHETPIPIINAYSTPETLGRDRLANAVAAWHLNPHQNTLVIDLGTCIKYDIITADKRYLGGNISPGLNMRFNALHHFTDQLPKLEPTKQLENSYGIDTNTSLQCGVIRGIAHEIEGFIERYKKEFSQLTIFMTGGDLKHFDKTDKKSIFANQNLTLIGLNEILNHNA